MYFLLSFASFFYHYLTKNNFIRIYKSLLLAGIKCHGFMITTFLIIQAMFSFAKVRKMSRAFTCNWKIFYQNTIVLITVLEFFVLKPFQWFSSYKCQYIDSNQYIGASFSSSFIHFGAGINCQWIIWKVVVKV